MSGVVTPVGAIMSTAQSDTSTPPAGWLFCDGSSQVRATYPALFAVIGTTYGSVDGTHFTLPDLRGRVVVTLDNAGGSDAARLTSANTLGTAGGEESHALTSGELASHTHTVGAEAAHTHGYNSTIQPVAINATAGVTYGLLQQQGDTTGPGSSHTHSLTNTGSGTAHNTMQPFITLNSIIKT